MRIDCTLNILLLDDELLILLDLEYAVETAGHQCVAVTDVASALNAIERNEIDAAILDITLAPGVDSIPVAQALRVRHIPFVFHSGDLGSGLIDQSQKMTVAARAMAEKNTVGHRS